MATNLDVDEYRKNGAFAALEPNWEKKLNSKIIAIGETSAQFYLYLTKKPTLRPDGVIDIKGWKIRTTGAYRPLVEALGATPVQITNAGEVYTALERGVVDGFGWPTVGPRLAEAGAARQIPHRPAVLSPGQCRADQPRQMEVAAEAGAGHPAQGRRRI